MSVQFVKDKAREISYALVRVAFYVKRDHLRYRLEDLSVELLEKAALVSVDGNQENVKRALALVSVLDGLIRLSHSIYEIEPVNATILVRELDSLNSAIRQSGNLDEELPDLETFFRVRLPQENKEEVSSDLESKFDNNPPAGGLNAAIRSPYRRSPEGRQSENGNSAIKAAIRQSAVVNRIRSGNGNGCRLKDLLTEFPDVSERTLRYDLQRLCEQGVIERVGNGGPASYYTLKQESSVIN